MTRQTTWSRLEPDPRTEGMEDGLRAQIRDPLWMLSRQWQVREFEGEDAGSPVRTDLTIAQDPLTRVDLRGAERDDSETGPADPLDYEGGPLEAAVERERVLTDDDPPTRLRAEAGQQFLRILATGGYGKHDPGDFPEEYHLTEPEEALEAPDRRYVDLMAGRTLDGTAIARAIQSAVDNIGSVVTGEATSWVGVSPGELPVPHDGSRNETFDKCIEEFYAWYVDIYDEPTTETGSAWDPTRLEYRFSVGTGDTQTETVFDASEYQGGHLDWYAFSADRTGESLDPPDDMTTTREKTVMPTQISFPGMPAARWWELEDSDVDLAQAMPEGAPLSRAMLAEFATVYGNDWFRIPIETPVGTFTRLTDLTVTDTFGVTETAEDAIDEDWQLFMHEAPQHDEAGLFVPPTLATSWTGDPVEKVTFARDEIANLVFGIERIYEGPTGRAVDRTEFNQPEIVVETVHEREDPDKEFVEIHNPGEDGQPIGGFILQSTSKANGAVYTFNDRELDPNQTLRIYTGTAPDDEQNAVSAGNDESVWADSDSLSVWDADENLVRRKLLAGSSDALGDYRLSTDVPDYWFPFTAERDDEYRLERALLLDADSLGLPIERLPRPLGEILDPSDEQLPVDEDTYQLYDEEVTRSGSTVTRRYQFARWLDGSAYLWSSRESRLGDSQLDSGLQFDITEERE
jgi:hypothetical protein